eukprot:SAG11_NODE_22429_length_406_cov_0.843648_1_plen_31_part_10
MASADLGCSHYGSSTYALFGACRQQTKTVVI